MSYEQPDHHSTPSSDTPPLLTPTALAPEAPFATSTKNPMTDSHPASLTSAGSRPGNGSSISTTEDTNALLSSLPALDGTRSSGSEADNATASDSGHPRDVDPQIVEALRGKDRIYVLKLGEMLESLINEERRPRVELAPVTSYQRLLVHRCSAYYKLSPETDPMSKTIYVFSTSESRMPPLKISELVPAETTTAPAFKIMRRSSIGRRSKPSQQAASVTTDEADLSDLDPSETGSLGGRSNTTGGSTKKRMTIEQREAAYNEARNRIFMDFEEKEKVKDKDINSSSSSLSTASGSVKNGGSSAGDADSSSGSPATESEWSGPTRRHDQRHNSGYASASSSTRSIRSPAYINNGSGSSRNSRAASPSSFQYPSLYEPAAPSVPLYDAAQHSTPSAPMYPHPPYGYGYAQGQPNSSYVPYPYYPPPYPHFTSPPHPQQNVPDPTMTSNGEPYPSPPHMSYGPPYLWPQQHAPSPQLQPHSVPPHPPPNGPHPMNSSAPGQPPYQQYMPPPPTYSYPMPGYYPPQPGHHVAPPPPPPTHPPPPMHAPQMYESRVPNNNMGNNQLNGFRNSIPGGNGTPSSSVSRPPPRNAYNYSANGNGPKSRQGVVQPARAPWSYGPGIGSGGMVSTGPQTHDTVGPRLSNSRRQSNLSNSSANGRSASGDDGSSVTSSTSSSSRRAQTVSAGSQHPLPARPDWAINLKPSHNPRNMPPSTPPRSFSGSSTQSGYSRHAPQLNSPASLQSTDFPPLTTMQPPERRVPTGAWGNPSSRPNFSQINNNDDHEINNRLDDSGFERPPPKSAELYNPKTPKRVPMNAPNTENRDPSCEVDNAQDAINRLGDKVSSLSLASGAPVLDYSASASTIAPDPTPA
ncbi:hypothetical protein Agabi119p4_6357 [Agaricus bisporus var. burnettii]|uniref:SUZ domain-containing protein n=1 Tax=Agaricus bisporus var. burnettii TaxID=192524 RepID=A0A8H7C9T6_AGABI|nr:hypothetical protein Agabi119p4_6357 [Agaricus bisporus var. burnettii]